MSLDDQVEDLSKAFAEAERQALPSVPTVRTREDGAMHSRMFKKPIAVL